MLSLSVNRWNFQSFDGLWIDIVKTVKKSIRVTSFIDKSSWSTFFQYFWRFLDWISSTCQNISFDVINRQKSTFLIHFLIFTTKFLTAISKTLSKLIHVTSFINTPPISTFLSFIFVNIHPTDDLTSLFINPDLQTFLISSNAVASFNRFYFLFQMNQSWISKIYDNG